MIPVIKQLFKPHMKLHHLLQKCSFFLIKLAAFQASGAACMKLQFLFRLDRPSFWLAAGLTRKIGASEI
jgi:hypothetical protein